MLRALSLAGRKTKSRSKRTKAHSSPRRRFVSKAVRWAAIAVLILGLIPATLTVLYRFEFVHPISTVMILDRLSGTQVSRQWVEIEDVAPVLKHSVMMSEDGQFCRHHGIDLGEFRVVLQDALRGEPSRGASTITMQTAKNLFLSNSRSYFRKALELPIAIWIDLVMPKERIFEIYLNIAEWGPGIYGIDQAAGYHFGKSASQLNARESALLAVTLPNPNLRDPRAPSERMNRLVPIVERRARNAGAYITCLQ